MFLVKTHHQTRLFSVSQEEQSHSAESSRTSLRQPGTTSEGLLALCWSPDGGDGGDDGLTVGLVKGVVSQSEGASALATLETAAMEEETFCTQTLHHIKSLLTDGTHLTGT